MNKKTTLALAAGLALAVTASFGAANAASHGGKTKACFVYIGPTGDFGWTYQHDQGRLAVEKAFGDKVETAYLESVPESSEAQRPIEGLARSGCNIIFTTSFNYMDPTNKAAKKYPDVKFEQALIDLKIDSDEEVNGYILKSDAQLVSFLDLSNRKIKKLTGIQAFTSLSYLDCRNNELSNIDFSQNISLTTLFCDANDIITPNEFFIKHIWFD